MNIINGSHNLLAKEKLGINLPVNLKLLSVYILQERLKYKKELCKIV